MNFYEFNKKLELVNLKDIHEIELTKFVRENIVKYDGTKLGLRESLFIARMVKEAHRYGVIRGRLLGQEK